MKKTINIGQLKMPQDVRALVKALEEIFDLFDIIYTTVAPNGVYTTQRGKYALYNNSGKYTLWVNTTGAAVWEQASLQADGAVASTGIGSIKMASINNADSAGFLKFKKADGTYVYVPYFTTDSP